MKDVIGGLFALLLAAAAIGLFIAAVVWTFYNVWLVLGILAAIVVLLIIYGMVTSDNDWVSIGTQWVLMGVGCFVAYLVFA